MAAPVGVVSSPCPSVSMGIPRSSAAVAGAGTGTRPCAVRTRPVPTTGGNDPIEAGASQAIAAATPDDVGDRVVGADLVEGHAVDARAVERRLDLGDAREDVAGQRPGVGVEPRARQEPLDLGVVAVSMRVVVVVVVVVRVVVGVVVLVVVMVA